MVVVCDLGPLPEKEGDQVRPDDWTPARIKETLRTLRMKEEKEEKDPVDLIRFGPILTPEQVEEAKAMLREIPRELWAVTNHDLAHPINVIEHHIHVSNPAPICRTGASKSIVENEALYDWAGEMKEVGILGNSTSLNNSPLVVALKKPKPPATKPGVRVCNNF